MELNGETKTKKIRFFAVLVFVIILVLIGGFIYYEKLNSEVIDSQSKNANLDYKIIDNNINIYKNKSTSSIIAIVSKEQKVYIGDTNEDYTKISWITIGYVHKSYLNARGNKIKSSTVIRKTGSKSSDMIGKILSTNSDVISINSFGKENSNGFVKVSITVNGYVKTSEIVKK